MRLELIKTLRKMSVESKHYERLKLKTDAD